MTQKIKRMKQINALFVAMTVALGSQAQPTQPAKPLPKDAQVNVSIIDMRTKQPRNNELIVFHSQKNDNKYEGISDETGKFNLRLPSGDKYEIYIMGFKDSTSYNVLDIPALAANAFYKNPFSVDIEFDPPKDFVLDNVEFDFGKSTLRPSSYPTLDQLVEYLQRKDDERVEIGGHTDNIGTPARNLKLSQERAQSIVNYLISKGIGAERVTAKGYGATDPIAENNSEEGRQRNRRTEVKIL
jgi:OmpA-OmpF porin, OOP family